MSDTLKKSVEAALNEIKVPGADQSVMEAGLVSAIVVDSGKVGIILELSGRDQAGAEALRTAIESAARAVEGVEEANVIMTAARQAQAAPKGQPVGGKAPPTPTEIPGVKHIVAVASGKGGVGKSTTSINLAVALRDQGLKVGVLDADIFGPSLPMLLGVDDKPDIKNKIIQPIVAHGLKVMSIGFLIDVDQPVVWRGPRVMGATQQLLKDVAWGPLDVLIVDMPPGTGDVQLTMVQQAPLTGAVIVSTPQDLALIDARKGLAMFRKVDVPIMGIIENMSTFHCPHCGEESHIFGHGGAADTAGELGCDFLGGIPLHMSVREHADSGDPIVAAEPDSPVSKAYRAIAAQVSEKLGVSA
ncbi:Mrp/NBP35 family ATP-binding protein [Kordiimonas lacus]|uniref:Iron-sulfur cluster carrier protein n=1 Tax=Kordiimonas lacus TaxID=637679 RepID=A0A1G7AVH1_9PROT|nr:Mrp/NBP35 family ATP-binding protein [Kordiimonas lacus]SDE18722.1 ATP-binding protein involved in chromosome partitioning [Kordiimonas lacus]